MSFDLAEYTANVDAVGTLRLLDAIKTCGMENTVRFYQVHVTKQISLHPLSVLHALATSWFIFQHAM